MRSFKRNMLELVGIDTAKTSLIGNVEGSAKHRERWLTKMHDYGVAGS